MDGAYTVNPKGTMVFEVLYYRETFQASPLATWGAQLQVNVDSWKVVKIAGKNHGIVATRNLPKGTIIAMYGGVIFDRNEDKWVVASHSLNMKDSGKTLAIDGYKCNLLPKFAQGDTS